VSIESGKDVKPGQSVAQRTGATLVPALLYSMVSGFRAIRGHAEWHPLALGRCNPLAGMAERIPTRAGASVPTAWVSAMAQRGTQLRGRQKRNGDCSTLPNSHPGHGWLRTVTSAIPVWREGAAPCVRPLPRPPIPQAADRVTGRRLRPPRPAVPWRRRPHNGRWCAYRRNR
jgi:hypothetical protein